MFSKKCVFFIRTFLGPKKRDRDSENVLDQGEERPVKFVKREKTDSPRRFNENSRENNLSENYTSELSPGAEKLVAGPGQINDQLGDAFGKELTDFNLIKTAGEEKTIKATLVKEKFNSSNQKAQSL